MRAAQTQLIPMQEMTPGTVVEIRNSVIESLVKIASKELSLPAESLIVRDIHPMEDLLWLFSTTSSATTGESWERNMTESTVGYVTVATGTMVNQRYVAIFGIRDGRRAMHGTGATTITTIPTTASSNAGDMLYYNLISLVRFTIGGAIKAIWDTTSLLPYHDMVGFSPSAIIIPQNAAFTIAFYKKGTSDGATSTAEISTFLQLVGVVVEPRGKVISA